MIHATEPGTRVWVLAFSWWRRAVIVAPLRTRVIIRFALADGTTRDTRRDPVGEDVQPEGFDPIEAQEELRPCAQRPIAKASLWESRAS